MKYSVIETISRTQKVIFVSFQSVLLIGMTLLSQASGDEAAAVYLNQLEQEYNGTPKFPNISTDPPGLAVDISITPRSQSETVFQTIPAVLLPSYASYGINGTPNKALGDEVNLGGSKRILESIEVSMVSWSKAADWPALAGKNPPRYPPPGLSGPLLRHPLGFWL